MSNELPDVRDAVDYDSETGMYRATFDTLDIDPSMAVIEALANICGQDPTELDPLYNVINLDALDKLLLTSASRPYTGDRKVEFTFQNHKVIVLNCGIVKIQPVTTADGNLEE